MNDASRVLSYLRAMSKLGNAPKFATIRDTLKIDASQLERVIVGLINHGEIVRYAGGYQIPREAPVLNPGERESKLDVIDENDHTMANDVPDGPSFMLDAPDEIDLPPREEPEPMTPKVEMKTCTGECGQTLPFDQFYPGHGKCKPCFAKHHNAQKLAKRDAQGKARPGGVKKPPEPENGVRTDAPPLVKVNLSDVTQPNFHLTLSFIRNESMRKIMLHVVPGLDLEIGASDAREILQRMEEPA